MPESIGVASRHQQQPRRSNQPQNRTRPVVVDDAGDDEALRRRFADRMQIRKTQAIAEPKWGLLLGTLLIVAMTLGIGVGVGGGLVAVGIGLGWLSVALVALIWRDLEQFYLFWQQQSK